MLDIDAGVSSQMRLQKERIPKVGLTQYPFVGSIRLFLCCVVYEREWDTTQQSESRHYPSMRIKLDYQPPLLLDHYVYGAQAVAIVLDISSGIGCEKLTSRATAPSENCEL